MAMIQKTNISTEVAYNTTTTISLDRKYNIHQCTVETSAVPATGTMSVEVKFAKTNSFEIPIDNAGNEISIDLTNPKTFVLNGWIDSVRFIPSSFDNDKTYNVTILSGV